jgi:hypothetical protein
MNFQKNNSNFKKVTLFLWVMVVSPKLYGLGLYDSLKKAAFQKNVWIPSATALAFGVSDFDGKWTRWASEHRPLFKREKRASQYSDFMTFYYFPIFNLVSRGINYDQNKTQSYSPIGHLNFLVAPTLTYFLSWIIKDRTGRIRPDASNNLSFPSAHTSIASSMNEEFFYSMKNGASSPIYIINEGIVGTVALARLEARRHHLTDVLVGYSLGKFVSHFLHAYLFNEEEEVRIALEVQRKDHLSGQFKWSF